MNGNIIKEIQSSMNQPMEIGYQLFVASPIINRIKHLYDDIQWGHSRHFPGFMMKEFTSKMEAETMYQSLRNHGEVYKNYD